MTEEQKEAFKQRCKRWCEKIIKDIDEKHPDIIVGHAVACLFHVSLACMGEVVTREFSKRLIENARQSAGLCYSCDNEILTRKSFHPTCEACDARSSVEYLQFGMDCGDESE